MEGRRISASPRVCSGRRILAKKRTRVDGFVNSVKKLQRREICSKRDRAFSMSNAQERFRNMRLMVSCFSFCILCFLAVLACLRYILVSLVADSFRLATTTRWCFFFNPSPPYSSSSFVGYLVLWLMTVSSFPFLFIRQNILLRTYSTAYRMSSMVASCYLWLKGFT